MYYYLKQGGFYFKKAHKIKMTQVSSSNKPHISEKMFLIHILVFYSATLFVMNKSTV